MVDGADGTRWGQSKDLFVAATSHKYLEGKVRRSAEQAQLQRFQSGTYLVQVSARDVASPPPESVGTEVLLKSSEGTGNCLCLPCRERVMQHCRLQKTLIILSSIYSYVFQTPAQHAVKTPQGCVRCRAPQDQESTAGVFAESPLPYHYRCAEYRDARHHTKNSQN